MAKTDHRRGEKKRRAGHAQRAAGAQSVSDRVWGARFPESLYEAVAEVLNWVYQLAQAEEA